MHASMVQPCHATGAGVHHDTCFQCAQLIYTLFMQALFNLAMLPEHVSIMTRYKVPNYIHMANMPVSHLRPLTAPPALGQRMAKMGLTGTAPARPSVTAPAGMASITSGLG